MYAIRSYYGPLFSKLQKGNPVEVGGKVVKPEEVMGTPRPGRTIVYSGDTRPCEAVLEVSRDADLLIHDGSFADEMADWAEESMHSTAGEVATLAKEAGVKKLVLTHISSRYTDDVEPILKDSKKVFENVIVAEDLMDRITSYNVCYTKLLRMRHCSKLFIKALLTFKVRNNFV